MIPADEESYLLNAFGESPQAWFRPREVTPERFSPSQTDRIVESLAQRGLLDAQPGCHARLTPRGRKQAAKLHKLEKRSVASARRRPGIMARGGMFVSRILGTMWGTR